MKKYDLLALDLDGTLVAPGESISPASRDAIARAQAAGLRVVPCTGRAWREAAAVLSDVPQLGLGVFSSGAVVADLHQEHVLNTAGFDAPLAHGVVEVLHDLPHAVLVFQDIQQAGRDFLVTGAGELTDNTRDWFESKRLTIEVIPDATPRDLEHSLRIGIVAPETTAHRAEAALRERFGDRINAHCLAGLAVTGKEAGNGNGTKNGASEPVYLLEVFAAGTHKWRGLEWLARHQGVDPSRVAAVGDQVNDLAMLRGAGLGVAMGDAPASVTAAADRVTRPCAGDGVAHAIEQILRGAW